MPLNAIGLLLVAALLHAGWNLLLKSATDRYLVNWLALLASALVGLPALLLGPALPAAIWPYVLLSGVAEAVYFGLLVTAYQAADFSLVYPIARGAAPAMLALWAAIFLGERPSAGGLAGLALLVAGLLVVGLRLGPAGAAGPGRASIALALGVSLCISIYSAIDAAAVRHASPLPYTAAVFMMTVVVLTPLMLRRYGPAGLLAGGRAYIGRALLLGGLMLATYAIVLWAYAIAPVSYAGAVRESSIVVGALAGWLVFGEPFGAQRVVGALIILAGIATIAVWG